MDRRNGIADRLKKLRDTLELTQEEFGRDIGKSLNTVLSWETGKTRPTEKFLVVIEKLYNLSPGWLVEGKGQMFMRESAENYTGDMTEVNIWELAGAGDPMFTDDVAPIECIILPKKLVGGHTNGFKVRGDSMYPTIVDGAYVGFDMNDKKVVSNGVYCLNLPYEGYVVKRLEITPNEVIIKSDNKMVMDSTIPLDHMDNNLIIGRVKWVYQNM